MIFSASAVVSLGCTTAVVTVAVRVGQVSAGTKDATTDFSSRVAPAADGHHDALLPLKVILASRGLASSPAVAAALRTAATSFALSTTGASLPAASAFIDRPGAKAAGDTAKDLAPTLTVTGPDIAGVANSATARSTSSADTAGAKRVDPRRRSARCVGQRAGDLVGRLVDRELGARDRA